MSATLKEIPKVPTNCNATAMHACLFVYEKQHYSSIWVLYVIALYNADAWRPNTFPSFSGTQQTKQPNKSPAVVSCQVSWLPDDISPLCPSGHDLWPLHRPERSSGVIWSHCAVCRSPTHKHTRTFVHAAHAAVLPMVWWHHWKHNHWQALLPIPWTWDISWSSLHRQNMFILNNVQHYHSDRKLQLWGVWGLTT